MRTTIIAAGLATVACLTAATSSHATYYGGGPWCLRYDIGSGTSRENCELPSFEACAQERPMWGTTAFCSPNPGFAGYTARPVVHKRKRHGH